MLKSKAKPIAMTLIILCLSLFIMNKNLAKQNNNNETEDWKVKITSDTKELKDTQEIIFKLQDNQNVVEGKIAPGAKLVATIEIDLTGTKYSVDMTTDIDKSNFFEGLNLTAKLDGEFYDYQKKKTIEVPNKSGFTEENGKKILTLELEWENDDNDNYNYNYQNTNLGIMGGTIKIPVTIEITQHI